MSTDAEKKAAKTYREKLRNQGLESYRREIKPEYFPKMDLHLEKLKKDENK